MNEFEEVLYYEIPARVICIDPRIFFVSSHLHSGIPASTTQMNCAALQISVLHTLVRDVVIQNVMVLGLRIVH